MNRLTSLWLAFSFLVVFLLLTPIPSQNSQASDEMSESLQVDIRLDGPTVIGTQQETPYQLRISYDFPERILNYSFTAELTGANIIGGDITPNNGTSENGLFLLTITGPTNRGELIIRVNATAVEQDVIWYRIKEFELNVVEPIHISATLYNRGDQDVNNVVVQLFVDGALKDTKYYSIAAGSSTQVSFNWTFSSIASGEHIVKLVADGPLDLVEFSEGDNVLLKSIYYSKPGNLIRGILSVLIIFVSVILALTILQKRGPQKM